MKLEFLLTGSIDVPEGSRCDGSTVYLPGGRCVSLDVFVIPGFGPELMHGLTDEQALALGVVIDSEDVQLHPVHETLLPLPGLPTSAPAPHPEPCSARLQGVHHDQPAP